ncbi:MAG: response regulator transcription factor [Nitrosospira multiformis]|nr:response regulator transcription factor [Nitrosospira multiformis]
MDEQLSAPIRILLIGGYPIVLFGLKNLIESQTGRMKMAGQFTHYSLPIPEIEELAPDVIVIDPDQEPREGMEAIRLLGKACRAKVMVFSTFCDPLTCNEAVLGGAMGLVGKQEPLEIIPKAIEKIHEGQFWLNRTNIGKLIHQLRDGQTPNQEEPKIKALTTRERAIVAAVVSNAEVPFKVIADMLHISERTLRNHLSSIYEKLSLSNRLGLLAFGRKHDLEEDRTLFRKNMGKLLARESKD